MAGELASSWFSIGEVCVAGSLAYVSLRHYRYAIEIRRFSRNLVASANRAICEKVGERLAEAKTKAKTVPKNLAGTSDYVALCKIDKNDLPESQQGMSQLVAATVKEAKDDTFDFIHKEHYQEAISAYEAMTEFLPDSDDASPEKSTEEKKVKPKFGSALWVHERIHKPRRDRDIAVALAILSGLCLIAGATIQAEWINLAEHMVRFVVSAVFFLLPWAIFTPGNKRARSITFAVSIILMCAVYMAPLWLSGYLNPTNGAITLESIDSAFSKISAIIYLTNLGFLVAAVWIANGLMSRTKRKLKVHKELCVEKLPGAVLTYLKTEFSKSNGANATTQTP